MSCPSNKRLESRNYETKYKQNKCLRRTVLSCKIHNLYATRKASASANIKYQPMFHYYYPCKVPVAATANVKCQLISCCCDRPKAFKSPQEISAYVFDED